MTTQALMSVTTMRKRTSRSRLPAGVRHMVSGCALGAMLALGTGAGLPLHARAAAVSPAGGAAVGKVKPTKAPTLLTVDGTVQDKGGAPIQGAVVYLQDTKSMAVKSFLSDADGHFHFRQLPLSTDFGLWAELNGKRTKTRNISQFNSKPDLHYTLKLDVAK